MRVRRIAAAAAAVALSLTLAACGSDDSAEPETEVESAPTFEAGTTMATLSEKGSITVGTKFDQPLFGLKGLDGKPQGFDVEVAKIIAGAMGISPENINYIETPSAIREEVIEQKRADMVVATYTIKTSARRDLFAGPYYVAGQDIMVLADNPKDITGPDSFKTNGAKVCSVTGSTPSENIKQYLGSPDQLVLFDVYSKCADALRTGQVDAVTTDNVILLGLIDASADKFELVGEAFTEEPYASALPRDVAFCEFTTRRCRQRLMTAPTPRRGRNRGQGAGRGT